jgi:hypothetical protein
MVAELRVRGFQICEMTPKADAAYLEGAMAASLMDEARIESQWSRKTTFQAEKLKRK